MENLFVFRENIRNFLVIFQKYIKAGMYGIETICHRTTFVKANLPIHIKTRIF